MLFFKGELSCPYIKGHELQARASVGVLPYIKGELPFAPTPAHANFSQTISDWLLLEGTSYKLAPARGLKDTSYKLAPAWGLLLEGTSYKLAPAWGNIFVH